WLEADGFGGFASGTVGTERTRRYHALLLAATRAPGGRVVLVNGAEAWLDGILANRLPKIGRVNLAHHLTEKGGVQAEYVVSRLDDGTFYMISTPRAERWN
ncbi:glycogen debranching enzyme N-terminal domain-containing protein, partial [Paraburkholderia sp. SIMBA_054]|uniref:glycogen debranching enzyme N-terminal domain-containing protein n=1 Tax=Paraburkholderia sp. SIMBA_054 TaxID=3085795 RepID=UPI00397C47C4